MFGLLGIFFGVLGFFTFGLVFIPLGLLCTIISFASKNGFLLGIVSFVMNVVAIAVSPSIWLLIAGLLGGNIETAPTRIKMTVEQPLRPTHSIDKNFYAVNFQVP
ncbi:MAG: hypothetical protein WCF51_06380 [Nitrosomonadaceae bacterium]